MFKKKNYFLNTLIDMIIFILINKIKELKIYLYRRNNNNVKMNSIETNEKKK